MKKYTVVGFYEDTRESWVEYGRGRTVKAAIKDASKKSDAPGELVIVAVFSGHLRSV